MPRSSTVARGVSSITTDQLLSAEHHQPRFCTVVTIPAIMAGLFANVVGVNPDPRSRVVTNKR